MTAIDVGKRYGEPKVLKISALKMQQAGFTFFLAENGVWLSERVPALFIEW